MFKYVYLDDENSSAISAMASELSRNADIIVETFSMKTNESFENLIKRLVDYINKYKIDGLLMDMCLDGNGVNRINVSAAPIAQQIRTLASTNQIREVAIILCSTQSNIDQIYRPDITSHDLYDYKYEKGSNDKKSVAMKMEAIADSYHKIILKNGNCITIEEILNRNDLYEIDDRIFSRFTKYSGKAYDLIRYLKCDILSYPGILIDEKYLFARLGVSETLSSSEAKSNLLEYCKNEFMYKGFLCKGWKRYWMDKIHQFFKDDGRVLYSMNAEQRVEFITKKLCINGLEPAEKIKLCKSSYFDTICYCSKKPMDSEEGFEIFNQSERKPWQESRYVSLYELRTGNAKAMGFRLTAEDENRANEIVRSIQNEQQSKQ